MIPFSFVLAVIVAWYAYEHTTSFEGGNAYALFFSFILTLLGCTIPCAIFCAISMIRKERLALLSLIPGIPCGIIALLLISATARGYIAVKAENGKREASSTLKKKLLADARADAACILKERWDLQSDDAHVIALNSALLDPEVHISDPLAHEIYQTMPAARFWIIQRPAFDTAFLRNLFQEMKTRAPSLDTIDHNDWNVLNGIVCNPNCPNEILEEVVAADDKTGSLYSARNAAQQHLKSAQKTTSTPASSAP